MSHRPPVLLLGAAAFLLTLTGCAVPTPLTSPSAADTLATNPDAPQRVLSEIYGHSWENIANLRYDAYVYLDGAIGRDGDIRSPKFRTRFPDQRRDRLALQLIRVVRLPSSSVASRVRSRAKVQVYFFERDRMQPEAFLVAWREGGTAFTQFNGRDVFAGFVSYSGSLKPSPAADSPDTRPQSPPK